MPPLIADANVLIDFANSDQTLLRMAARHYGGLSVPLTIVGEVDQFTIDDLEQLGLHIVEPTLAQAIEAERFDARISFEDRLCLILARDHAWTCLTNDKRLRRECASWGVECLWGIEMMRQLVDARVLKRDRAIRAAGKMVAANPFLRKVVANFLNTV